MKYLRSLVPVLALALLGAGCVSEPAVTVTPTPTPTPIVSATSSEPALLAGAFKTKNGKLDNIRNVKLVTAKDGLVSSPLLITGQARLWYFEGVFPIKLVDGSGRVIIAGQAEADGEWTTSEWVPFTAELIFPAQLSGSTGKLILMTDNPSGLPEQADQVEIPVRF